MPIFRFRSNDPAQSVDGVNDSGLYDVDVNDPDAMRVMHEHKKRGMRLQVKFWLNANVAQEYEIYEWIKDLKKERRWKTTLLISLRLYWSLQQGRIDFLLAMYPHLEEIIIARYKASRR